MLYSEKERTRGTGWNLRRRIDVKCKCQSNWFFYSDMRRERLAEGQMSIDA